MYVRLHRKSVHEYYKNYLLSATAARLSAFSGNPGIVFLKFLLLLCVGSCFLSSSASNTASLLFSCKVLRDCVVDDGVVDALAVVRVVVVLWVVIVLLVVVVMWDVVCKPPIVEAVV